MISLRSKVTQAALNYFFINSEKRHYVNELARMLALDPKNLYVKLKELEKAGFLKSEFAGKLLYFSLNENFPLREEYGKVFLKTTGLEKQLEDALKSTQGVKKAYIFGSYAKDKMDALSDIDVLVVGEHSAIDLQKTINKIQKIVGREINVVNMATREFTKKLHQRNSFLRNVLTSKRIKLI